MTRTDVGDPVPVDGAAADARAPARRRRWTVLAAVGAVLVVATTVALVVRPWAGDRTYDDPTAWQLAWADEFDGPALDPARWGAEDTSTFGDGNLELACLMDRPDNIALGGGELALTARRETPALPCGGSDERFPAGRAYSSAMVSTQGRASWQYGRIEIRAALPTTPGTSAGLWPALWLRPDDRGVGEIDIMEALGTGVDRTEAGRIHQTLHYDFSGTYPKVSTTPVLPAGFDPTAFHVYAVQMRPERIEWLVDGAVTMTVDPETAPWVAEVMRSPYFLRMNVAVGGKWPGSPTLTTELPASMRVDWVRVYQP
jgi:beta-glucanase (GH16 family)